jgi:hypothetical protein
VKRAVLLAALLLANGCSQAAALAPVGGGREALVRFAGSDVLVERGVPILRAPACTQDAAGVVCTGTTTAGQPIRFEGPPGDPATLVVTVGAQQLYSGSAQDVVDRSGRPS